MSLLTNSKTGVARLHWITVTDIMVGSGGGKRELDAVPEHESNLDWAQCKYYLTNRAKLSADEYFLLPSMIMPTLI